MFEYKVIKTDKNCSARTGVFITPHGKIHTPVFMPVGTQGSVKSVSPKELDELNIEIILGNTYHLFLRPGLSVINKFGGLHKFIAWNKPILTDSGGFQVFSLKKTKIVESGVWFNSHIDGTKHFITPQKLIQIQKILGADIIMAFDHCPAGNQTKKYIQDATTKTHQWLDRSVAEWKSKSLKNKHKQALFGIIQGGIYKDLRKISAEYIISKNLPGNAIGGLAVGENISDMWKIVKQMDGILPKAKPRYLMGVGEPGDLVDAIENGMDMFDCVLPTRIARNGVVFTKFGRLNLLNSKYKYSTIPIDKNCMCYACQNFSQAYIRHLLSRKEILGLRLTTLHNLYFIQKLIFDIRDSINHNNFLEFKKNFLVHTKNNLCYYNNDGG